MRYLQCCGDLRESCTTAIRGGDAGRQGRAVTSRAHQMPFGCKGSICTCWSRPLRLRCTALLWAAQTLNSFEAHLRVDAKLCKAPQPPAAPNSRCRREVLGQA